MRSLQDHFLIAMPAMGDPNFNETVTYVCKHDAEGALGIVINRPTEMSLGEVFAELAMEVRDQRQAATRSVRPLPTRRLRKPDRRPALSSARAASVVRVSSTVATGS